MLETLAAGKALVASPRAVEGLRITDGESVLIADRDDEFAATVSELGWDRIVDAYEALYGELLAGRE